MTALFWTLKPAQMARLIQFQYERYGTRLDIEKATPPWQLPDIAPEISVRTEMTEDQLGKFISRPPQGPEKVD